MMFIPGSNIEGSYEDIIAWLDENKFYKGVLNVTSHGTSNCVGLFTLVDNPTPHKGRWCVEFGKITVHALGTVFNFTADFDPMEIRF